MKKSRIKKLLVAGLCASMIASMAIGASAATNKSFSFSIASKGGTNYTAAATKTIDASFAEVQYTTISFGGSSGQLFTVIRQGTTNASGSKYLTESSLGTRNYTYTSGYGDLYENYKIYGTTSSGCAYSATLGGVWTP